MALLPSPRTSDTNGAGHHGDGGMDLRTAVAQIGHLCDGCNVREPWEHRCHGDSQFERNTRPLNTEVLLLPTPSVADSTGGHERRGGERGEELLLKGVARAAAEGALLPTPRATDGTKGGPNQRGSSGDLMLPSAVNLLPTPRASDGPDPSSHGRTWSATDNSLHNVTRDARWGEYEPAIRRWESITRPAPEPTKLNGKGNPKLSDEFDEWLMGFPAGWITDVPGISWNEVLKACGNGVVHQQGAAALRWLLDMSAWEVAA